MYIVNTTFVIEPQVLPQWLDLIKQRYIPFLGSCGFGKSTLTQIISVEAVDHFTYSLQVRVEDITAYKKLTEELFNEYITVADAMFRTKVVWFNSLMKIIQDSI